MRNLELVQCCHIDGLPELKSATSISVDCDTGKLYLATNDNILVCLDPQTQQILWSLSLAEHCTTDSDHVKGHVVSIQHLPDQQSVCIATSNGDVLLYNTVVCEVECVGSVASGLTSMTWSPDQELLILTTGADTIILMTKDFDPVIETAAHPQEFGEQKPITVGWGKKETQFHGSEGKGAAAKKTEEVKPALPWDDLRVRVSWRADGHFFVVSVINPENGARKLRVWNRECVLQFTSEDVNGLEQSLCWKPSGSLIASSQRLSHQHNIVFFEKNGLRHGQFTLPVDTMQYMVNEISWNTESSVLAVFLEDLVTTATDTQNEGETEPPKTCIQLWTVGNYHWYLKQSLQFPANCDEKVVAMHWDPEHAYRLHVMCHGGQYLQYTWSWATNHSMSLDVSDNANTAVIDGKEILITPFRKMVVPPPMAAYALQLAEPVNQVLFAPPPHSNNIVAVMQDGRIAFFESNENTNEDTIVEGIRLMAIGGNGFKAMARPPTLKGLYSIMDESGNTFCPAYPLQLHHFYWLTPDTIIAASSDPGGAGTTLYRIEIKHLETQLIIRSRDTIFGSIFRACSHPSTGKLALQLADGTVVDMDNEEITKLPQPCVHMAMCTIGGQDVILGLTERYRFYVNDKEVASNCTSFAIHDEFLLLTTHSHTCRAINLNTSLDDLYSLSQGKSISIDETIRRVERGSRIVIAVPNDTKLILQMPRGNLETIHPRALVLSAAKKLLDKLEYQKAFDILRRHRISMNLICDHNPKKFLETLDTMVTQLDSANNLNLFLTDLKEEDVSETMYCAAYRGIAREESKTVYKSNKVDVVCDALRESIYRVDPQKYFLTILTTHVKKTSPELEMALQKIQSLRDNPASLSGAPTADESLKYILYLVDVNDLFDVALGTYDFSLVIMVAEKSQKDPKEYLPFLNKLQKLETNYQRYSIDKHLKRYGKALEHISKCPQDFIECLALVKEHKLYSQAMELFPTGSAHYMDVINSYAEYLSEKKHTAEAALMYSLCEQWTAALDLYQSCGYWEQAFCMAYKLGYKVEQIVQLANELAAYLTDHNRHSEASVVLLEYANDVEEAIVTLITGQQWNEALRVMHKYNRTDFIETNMKPAVTECCSMYIATIDNQRSTFQSYKARLAIVRQLKEKARLEFAEGGEFNDHANADLYSDASSMTGSMASSSRSAYSAYTAYSSSTAKIAGRSSKNRRKAERKKHSLREGSPFEDVALIEALGGIMRHMDNIKGDVGKLLEALVLHGYRTEAGQLQALLGDFLKTMEKSIVEIWQPELDNFPGIGQQSFGPQSTSAAIAAAAINQTGTRKLPSSEDMAIFVPPKISKDETWKMHVLETR